MRFVLQGGIWKNTEDEILKAAVMKYGKNQWARISSLLVRKSPRQCKSRWYEWLDPAVKKTEWSRDEEEKLLHLAKLMPCQWRSIAPLVGRTAAQCLEHYEKLLDAASGRQVDPADDPRRLRPGEIDPQPEAKPARPDPIDMDEDEKEQLSEARARLANTMGKKAKRKAREKALDEAKRLAQIQKRREQKMAGISIGTRRRNLKRDMREINYNAEVPFRKDVPAGLHDTSSEVERARNKKFEEQELQRVDGVQRKAELKRQQAQDRAKMNKMKKDSLPAAIAKVNAAIDPTSVMQRRRAKLALPGPVLDDDELERVAKATAAAQREAQALQSATATSSSSSAAAAANALLGQYAATPQQTPRNAGGVGLPMPLRTPRAGDQPNATPSRVALLMKEAQQLAALTQAQTPLLGGDSVSLAGSDFGGITPARLTTPAHSGQVVGRASGDSVNATPLRDELRLNQDDDPALQAARDAAHAKAAAARQAMELRGALALLPAPSNEYELVAPPSDVGASSSSALGESTLPEDAADRDARLAAHARQLEARLLECASQPLKRALPRPHAALKPPMPAPAVQAFDERSSALVASELRLLTLREHAARPPIGGKPLSSALRSELNELRQTKSSSKVKLTEGFVDDDDIGLDSGRMAFAADLIETERRLLLAEHKISHDAAVESVEDMRARYDAVLFDPVRKATVVVARSSASEITAARTAALEAAAFTAQSARKRAQRLTAAANELHGDLERQARALIAEHAALVVERRAAQDQLELYELMAAREAIGAKQRQATLDERVQAARRREQSQQQRYGELLDLRNALVAGEVAPSSSSSSSSSSSTSSSTTAATTTSTAADASTGSGVNNAINIDNGGDNDDDAVNAGSLEDIEGIGKATATVLRGAGIVSLAKLAASTVDQLRAILTAAGGRYRNYDPTSWPEKAAEAMRGAPSAKRSKK